MTSFEEIRGVDKRGGIEEEEEEVCMIKETANYISRKATVALVRAHDEEFSSEKRIKGAKMWTSMYSFINCFPARQPKEGGGKRGKLLRRRMYK